MNISLPDSVGAYLEDQAAQAGLSLPEYVLRAALVASPEAVKAEDADARVRQWLKAEVNGTEAISQEAVARRKRELEDALLAGLESGPALPITPEFWKERQRILQERSAKRDGNEP